MSKQKGITPVIAIVLLLLITVGAVTVVYSQFQGLVEDNNAQDTLDRQQRIQQASYTISGVERTDDNTYAVHIKNTGDQIFDLEEEASIYVGIDGGQSVELAARGGSCTWDGDTNIGSGESTTCDTGIEWPDSHNDNGDSSSFELRLSDVVKDTYTCSERSGDDFC